MLSKAAAAALKAYTSLPAPLQGNLVRRSDGKFELGAALTSDSTFDSILSQADRLTMFCLRCLRVVQAVGAPPVLVESAKPFVVRGRAIRLEDGQAYAIVSVVSGEAPRGSTYMLRLLKEDFVQCATVQEIAFGTNSVTGSLVPGWNYLASMHDMRVERALVACPNGVFSLRTTQAAAPHQLAARDAERVLGNLRDLDFVIQVGQPAAAIYRFANNCVLAGPEGYSDAIERVQQSWGLPTYKRGSLAVAGRYEVQRSLLDLDGRDASEDTLAGAARAAGALLLTRQSLSKWWQAPVGYDISVEVRLLAGQDVAVSMELPIRQGGLEATIKLRSVPFRDLRPGENDASMRKAFADVATQAAAEVLGGAGGDQSALDAATQQLGALLQTRLGDSELFISGKAPVAVSVRIDRRVAVGKSVELPGGELVVVPSFSADPDSPRLAAYLGVLSAVGVQGSFHNWHAVKASGSVLF